MANNPYRILGVGTAIVDQIVHVSDAFLATLPGRKGGMEPVDANTFQKMISQCQAPPLLAPGGSAANLIRGLAHLGHACALTGTIGQDLLASYFLNDLKRLNITPLYFHQNGVTAQVLSLVTPDGQRTCRSYLAGANEIDAAKLSAKEFENVALVHIEGYTLANQDLIEQSIAYGQAAGAKISLDLASFEIVETHRSRIQELIKGKIDILFANDSEWEALTESSAKLPSKSLQNGCEVVVVSMGKRGCWTLSSGQLQEFPAYPVAALDSTGAGDLFASGFLHGYLNRQSLATCAQYGALLGAAVVQVEGTELPETTWERLNMEMHCKKRSSL